MKTPLKLSLLTYTAITIALGTLPSLKAAVLASDDFNYANATPLSSANGGSGFTGAYSVGNGAPENFLSEVRNGSPLSYPNYADVGGNYANLASGFGGPTFNFFQRDVDVAGAFSAYNDGTRVGLDNTTLYGSFAYNVASGSARFFLQGAATSPEITLPTNGSNSFFVFRIDFGAANADTFTYFNNPDLTTFNGTGGTALSGDFSFQRLGFVTPNDTNEVRVDAIRLGTTLNDVTGVPEPSTFAMLALGGLAFISARKKSRVIKA